MSIDALAGPAPTPSARAKKSGGFGWLMAHEARLALRSLPTNAGTGFFARNRTLLFWGIVLGSILHIIAIPFAETLAAVSRHPAPEQVMAISFFILIGFTILVARSLDGVTQLLYSRADLDLLLSSPLPQGRVFSARLVAVALQTILPAVFFTGPFANVAALGGDIRWLGLYPLVLALAALSTAIAAGLATCLFSTLGARRTRVVAQVVATLLATGIGAGAQLGKLLSPETQRGLAAKLASWSQSNAFAADSPLVWPARGLLGAPWPMLELIAFAAVTLAITGHYLAGRLAANAVTALGADMGLRDRGSARAGRGMARFSADSAAVLRGKEWRIALRSPWLVAELLTPLVYLLPPVLVLAKNAGGETPPLWLMASAVAMLASQIAAGISRLMISGEDAPDLVATAPVSQGMRDRAKIVAVIGVALALLLVPLALVFWHSAFAGLCGLAGSLAAVACVCSIHLWFRTPGKRQSFYGRTKVPLAVSIADQLIGLLIAATAGLAIRGDAWALATAAGVVALLLVCWHKRGHTAM